jgi:ankyrin repeat protein
MRGDVDGLRRLRDSGVDMNEGDYDLRTPLHVAVVAGHLNAVKYLIEEC